MQAKDKAKGRSRGSKASQVPRFGGWTLPHGLALPTPAAATNEEPGQKQQEPQPTDLIAQSAKIPTETNENALNATEEEDVSNNDDLLQEGLPKPTSLDETTKSYHTSTKVYNGEEVERIRMKTPVKDRSLYEKKVLVPYKISPFPKFQGPSAEDCKKVHSLLVKEHGPCPRPLEIPPPSLKVAGCGQVRQVCDALLRTVLSTNTQFDNADRAVQGLYKAIGTVTGNLGLDPEKYPGLKDCLDYNRLRSLPLNIVQKAIEQGGNHIQKGAYIKTTVDQIYNMNSERAQAFREETTEKPATVLAADKLSNQQKQQEIWMFDNGILHLEHLRALSEKDAMNELMAFRGVGVKVAACILLFCMQKPVFAIDTHCFRLAKWLRWIPRGLEKGGEDDAFAHLDSTVPDELKYDLHQQFIRHGQFCLRCKTNSNEGWSDWDKTVCPLEDLLQRTGKQKPAPKLKAKKSALGLEDNPETEAGDTNAAPSNSLGKQQKNEDSDYEQPAMKRARKPKGKNAELKPASLLDNAIQVHTSSTVSTVNYNNDPAVGSAIEDTMDPEVPILIKQHVKIHKAIQKPGVPAASVRNSRSQLPSSLESETANERQTRSMTKASNEKVSNETTEEKATNGLAEVDVAEAMLNPVMHQAMVLKKEADEESSGLSEHSDGEFGEFGE